MYHSDWYHIYGKLGAPELRQLNGVNVLGNKSHAKSNLKIIILIKFTWITVIIIHLYSWECRVTNVKPFCSYYSAAIPKLHRLDNMLFTLCQEFVCGS